MAETEFFGIRHHGPGSARALARALDDFKPDVILIEGPPEADSIVELAGDPEMVPPVALLAYVPGTGGEATDRRAAFWPFAEFSPEWQALRHAARAGVPARFCDLPATHQLADAPPPTSPTDLDLRPNPPDKGTPADDGAADETPGSAVPDNDTAATTVPRAGANGSGEGGATGSPAEIEFREGAGAPDEDGVAGRVRVDPLGWLAEAAGYDDAERWWDDVVEHRGDGPSAFPAIAEAMATLREHAPEMPDDYTRREEQREAYMRRTLRRTLKEGYERVAVVCGAWHVPAIAAALSTSRSTSAAHDDKTLRGLPKVKVATTWVPWTHGRLASWSGYGAGVRSPGWYHHLFTAPDRPIERWLTAAARVLRDEDLHVSSAHVIEAVRLAETLAAIRDRPLAGLDEVTEATRAVLCEGADLPVELIQRRMVVGERLGTVPARTPMVPLQRDLQAEQRRLRLKPSALDKEHDLDLRKPIDLDRSRLLHRLRMLGIGWGVLEGAGRAVQAKGTFRETWTLMWQPEFDVDLIEASAWGTTVHGAATARAAALAADADTLAELTSVAERCLLADLGRALPAVMGSLADRAATDTDVVHLMAALPALVRVLRYGDVRGTGTGPLATVVDGLVVRICTGLQPAVSGLDDDAAREVLKHIDDVNAALALLDVADHLTRWQDTLAGLVDRPALHGLLEGRLTRLLHDIGHLTDVADRMARAVSIGETPARAAAWIEGFLSGTGLVLIHDDALLRLLDAWVAGLPAESFTDVLPLLRRTFATYQPPERRSLGDRVKHLGTRAEAPGRKRSDDSLDLTRAAPAVETVTRILGWPPDRADADRGPRNERSGL